MAGQGVKVRREILEACMTCPLCKKLLRDATTISLCLHTFCRKCIYEKLSDEEVDCCPVCNIDLGIVPVEKLRADHNLQDIRAKIFPYKRRKIKAPEATPSVTSPPPKRKERSLSSLVVSPPKMPIQTSTTGRRSRASARKASALLSSISLENEESAEDNHPMSSSSPESPKRQDSPVDDPSKEKRHDEVERVEGKADLWTPLNCLVEAANRSKSSKLNSQGISLSEPELVSTSDIEVKSRTESSNGHGSEVYMPKSKEKENGHDMKVREENNGANLVQPTVKRRRLTSRRRAALAEEQCVSAQAMVDAMNYRRNCPIWFSLVASQDQSGDASLPQISAGYLRIKDGNMPVSLIQKYLVKKLDLSSEAEVEVTCRGQLVPPTQQLHNVVDLWFRTEPVSKKVAVSVGSSAKDFVMVLSYRRKV